MWNPSRIADDAGSIYENFVVSLPTSEDTFAILSFNDLDFCSSSPCLDDSLMFSCPKLSLTVQNMDRNMSGGTGKTVDQPVPDGEEYFPLGSALAELSPGVEFADAEILLRDPRNPSEFLNVDEVGLLLDGGLKDSEDLNEEFEGFGSLSTIETSGIDAAWLTTVILPEQLKVKGTSVFEGGISTATFACKAEKILQEISIPSAVQDTSACDTDDEPDTSVDATRGSTRPDAPSKGRKRRRRSVDPDSDEYKKKREQNNISVRKSREKARQKQQVTEERVGILAAENDRLQSRVDSLEKELTILKGLFSNIGAAVPGDVAKFMSSE